MSLTAVDGGRPAGAGVSPREWWQVWAERRARWLAGHPVLARRARLVGAVLAWLAPVYLLVMVAVVPDVRAGARVWLGTLWVVVAWFFAARTKTLTWSGFVRFFSVCAVWSMVVGTVLRAVSADVGGTAGLGQGAVTFVAGIGEEALKVVPVVVLAVMAPRRVSRFAAVDFLLLGLASGAAFEAVEEAIRRTYWVTNDNKGLMALLVDVDSNGIPVSYVHYGVWPIPTEMVNLASWTADPVVFAGHAMTTALVCGVAGLGVVAWRAVRARSVLARVVVRPVVLVVPVVVLVTMMSDHLACNARLNTGDAWLAEGSAVPWWLQVPWQWTGQAQYRPAMFVALFVVCLAVDAFRLAARPATSLVPGPAWGWVAQVGAGLSAWHARARWPVRAVANTLNAALALVWVTGRDLGQAVVAHTRDPGEPRLAAARRAGTAVSAQRTAREAGMEHHAGQVRPWRVRLVAAGLLVGLATAALVLAPHLAEGTGPQMQDGWSWLSGLLDAITGWWDSLTPGQKIAVALAVGFAVALLPGLSFGTAFWIAGIATWGLDHHAGIKTFARDPQAATSDYLTNATPGQLALDGLDLALTAIPVGVGATTGRAARQATREFATDPAAFRAQRRAMMDDTGAAQIPHRPRVTLREFNAWQSTLPTRPAIYGSQDAQAFQHAVTGSTHEVKLATSDGTKIWADGVRYDPTTGGVAVEAKFVDKPGSSLYEGGAPQVITDKILGGKEGFDEEIIRYAKVIADPTNLVDRLDLVVSTDAAKIFLGSRMEVLAQNLGQRGLSLPFTIRVGP